MRIGTGHYSKTLAGDQNGRRPPEGSSDLRRRDELGVYKLMNYGLCPAHSGIFLDCFKSFGNIGHVSIQSPANLLDSLQRNDRPSSDWDRLKCFNRKDRLSNVSI